MKRLLFVAAAMLSLAACNRIGTRVYEDDLALPLAPDRADTLFFSASLEYLTGGMLIPAMEKVNAALVSQAFDLEDMSGTVEKCGERYRENLMDEYLNDNSSSWEDHLEGRFTGTYKGWLNYSLNYFSYRGGAHGLETETQIVFDRKSGETVTEDDIFIPGCKEDLARLILASVTDAVKEDDTEFLELLEPAFLVPNGNFSVKADGVSWIYQPYEAGPYALGLIKATVPWSSLKPYLK